MTHNLLKEKLEEFDKEFPAFDGVGAPFPIFKDTPNRNHIVQWLSTFAEDLQREVLEEAITAVKNSRTVDERYGIGAREELARSQAVVALLRSLVKKVEGEKV